MWLNCWFICSKCHLKVYTLLNAHAVIPHICMMVFSQTSSCFVQMHVCTRSMCVCVCVCPKEQESTLRENPPMPHSEKGFSESVMGIMGNMISYGYRMVNLLKPHWSLHAHCCYCPVMEATGECTMGNNQPLFVFVHVSYLYSHRYPCDYGYE